MHPSIDDAALLGLVVVHALGPFSFCHDTGFTAIKNACLMDQSSDQLPPKGNRV